MRRLLMSWPASASSTPCEVGVGAARLGVRPSSRSARAGFGPRVIVRTRVYEIQAEAHALGDGEEAPQAFAGQPNHIFEVAGGELIDPGLGFGSVLKVKNA